MSVIKIGFSGDSHTNTPGRVEEAHRVHETMLTEWTARGVDFIGFSGDWNEVPPNELDQAWSRDYLGRCAMVAPLIQIPGNHDPEGTLSEFHAQHEYKYPITVVTQPDVIRVETKAGPIAVACVPFVWKAHLLAKLGPLSPEESDREAEGALTDIFRGLGAKARAMNLPTVALIHGKWRGSKLNEEQPARPLGMEMAIEDIGQIGAQATCVAHIHLHQSTEYNGMPIFTPSSPYYVDYGESKHRKGYVFAELPTDRTLPAKWEHIQNPVAPMLLLEYKWEGGMFMRDGVQLHEEDLDATGTDIRFRFHYPKAEEKSAKGAAAELEKELLAAGAVKIKLDPIPIPTETTRSLEIVKAKTLTEKASLLWNVRGLNLPADEQQVCIGMIEELQTQCGFGQRLALDAGIHVKKTRMKGWRCFPELTEVDFDAIDGDIVAVSGPNGTGKSLFWELAVCGAIYRELPTHGNIGDHAIARDTFVETTFEYDGKEYTVSQIIDGKSGTGSSSLRIGNTPVFGAETALRRDYDKWVEDNLPPFSLVKSTTFMPQESKGILGMGTKDRKALVLRAKGAERYEILADAAGKRATATDRELAQVRARISELGALGGLAAFRNEVLRLQAEGHTAAEALRLGSITVDDLRAKNGMAVAAKVEYDALVKQRQAVLDERRRIESEIVLVTAKIQVDQEIVAEADEIAEAVRVAAAYAESLATLRQQEAELKLTQAGINSDWKLARGREEALREKLRALRQSIQNADTVLSQRGSIQEADELARQYETEARQLAEQYEAKWGEIEATQALATNGAGDRITGLRAGLILITEGCPTPNVVASQTIGLDNDIEHSIKAVPSELEILKSEWRELGASHKKAVDTRDRYLLLAARLPEIESAEKTKTEAEGQIIEVEQSLEAKTRNVASLGVQIQDTARDIASKAATSEAAEREVARLSPLVAKADSLKDAQTRIKSYAEQKTDLGNRLGGIEVPPVPETPPAVLDLSSFEAAVRECQQSVMTNATNLALAQRELVSAEEKEQRRDALVIEVRGFEKAIDRWKLVERTLGREGLQAEEVAAAGDEINELANELLRASGNTQYTVDLKTTKMTKDGKKEIEGCPINVYNAETGEWQEGSTLSPGQRAFVNLPISLSLAVTGCRESTVRPTIFLDEPTASLSPGRREEYVAMIRLALKKVNASKGFFISHARELIDLADAHMAIDAGRIEIQ